MTVFYNTNQPNLFNGFSPQNNAIKITHNLGGIDIQTPFSREFVDELKSRIPFASRSWDNTLRVWRVSANYIDTACEIVKEVYGFCPDIEGKSEVAIFTNQTYLIEYVGRSKMRDDNESIALGFCQNNWNVIFPEKVLREFFEGKDIEKDIESEPQNDTPKILNYYQLLGLKQTVEQSAIKSAYRRMAKQWHPDVCKESDARTRFEAINKAYQVLSEPIMRKRYDAGLIFEKQAKNALRNQRNNFAKVIARYGYAPPLRCGIVTVDGEYGIGKIIVSKINKWDDWIENGKTAVSSWNMQSNSIEVVWI